MKLRRLELKDAPLMLEWMHDQDVVEKMQADFASKTIEDCKKFIQDSQNNKMDLNLAIVDEQDIYMGTVSLKNITEKDAEFAITIRKAVKEKEVYASGCSVCQAPCDLLDQNNTSCHYIHNSFLL